MVVGEGEYIYRNKTEVKGDAFTVRCGVEFGSASRRFKTGLHYKNLSWEDFEEKENIYIPELGFEYRNKRFRYFMNVSYTIITSKGYDETIKELRVVPLGLGLFF